MPIYEFECPCGEIQEIYNNIQIGPPKEVLCKSCGKKMGQNYTTNVIFKGSWPGKDIAREREGKKYQGRWEEAEHIATNEHKEAQEVLKERRKGRKSFTEFKKHNKKKVERYEKRLRKGYRPK